MRTRLSALALACVLALALAACASSGSGSGESTPSPTAAADPQGGTQPTTKTPLIAFPDSPELAGWCPLDVEAVHLHQPADRVTEAVLCRSSLASDGTVTTTVDRVDAGLEKLLAAYSAPNAPVETGIVCTLQLEDPLLVWVSYPGERSYPIYAPVDACGFPSADAKAAFAAVGLVPVASFSAAAGGVVSTHTPGGN